MIDQLTTVPLVLEKLWTWDRNQQENLQTGYILTAIYDEISDVFKGEEQAY